MDRYLISVPLSNIQMIPPPMLGKYARGHGQGVEHGLLASPTISSDSHSERIGRKQRGRVQIDQTGKE